MTECEKDDECRLILPMCGDFQCQCSAVPEDFYSDCGITIMGCPSENACGNDDIAVCTEGKCEVATVTTVEAECEKDDECRLILPMCGDFKCQCSAVPEDFDLDCGITIMGCPSENVCVSDDIAVCTEGKCEVATVTTVEAECEKDDECRLILPMCGDFKCQCSAVPEDFDLDCGITIMGCPSENVCVSDDIAVCTEGKCEVATVTPVETECEKDDECRLILPQCGDFQCQCSSVPEDYDLDCGITIMGCPSENACGSDIRSVCVKGKCDVAPLLPAYVEPLLDWCKTADDCRTKTGTCGDFMCRCLALGLDEPDPLECPDGESCACARCAGNTCDSYVLDCLQGQCAVTQEGTERKKITLPPTPSPSEKITLAPIKSLSEQKFDVLDVASDEPNAGVMKFVSPTFVLFVVLVSMGISAL